jgi:hypothetical protein
MTTNDFPTIDPRIEYVGASKLRTLNTGNLGKLKKMLVIQDNDTPLAVLLNYEQYLIMQNRLQSVLKLVELYKNSTDATALVACLQDAAQGRAVDFAQIEATVK